MAHSRFDWQARIKAVELEYKCASQALDRLALEVARDPAVLTGEARPRDLRSAAGNLEGTYLVRMFAEFETGVRSYWMTLRKTRPSVENLVKSVGASCVVPTNVSNAVHEVRKYRNQLVHERESVALAISIQTARSSLSTYFARLPDRWD